MKLSLSVWHYSSMVSWLPCYPLDEVIERTARIGYPAIELGAASPHLWPDYLTPEDKQKIRKKIESHNLEISAVCPALGGGPGHNPASPNSREREASLDHYRKIIDLAVELGSKSILWLPGWIVFGVTQRQSWKWAQQSLTQCARYAFEKSITVVIEPTPADSDLIESADDALNMRKEVGLENIKVMFDTFHVFYRGESVEDYVERMKDHLAEVHLSDPDRLPPGTVRRDEYELLIRSLKEINFKGYLAVEVGFVRADPDAFSLRSYRYMMPLLEKYGGKQN